MKLVKGFFITATVSLAGLLTACGHFGHLGYVNETVETTDVFAPGREITIPQPFGVQAPVQVQQPVQVQVPQVEVTNVTPPPAIEVPVIQQPIAPAIIDLPPPRIVVPEQPIQQFDCTVVPHSKGGLSTYQQNCI